nr:FAD-dependent oxidoreductase [Cytophagales bacterium]
MTEKPKNIVLGAGVIGSAVAYELSKQGHDTLVIEKRPEPGKGTSRAAGGVFMYNKSIPRSDEWHAMASQAMAHHRRLDGELGHKLKWNWVGRAEIAHKPDDIEAIRAKYELERENGVDAQWLSPDDAAQMFSLRHAFAYASGGGFEGYINKNEGWVNPIELCATLREASEENGARFSFDTTIERVSFSNGQAFVHVEGGEVYQADNVIVALGPDLSSINIEGVDAPVVTPVKGQSLLMRDVKTDFDAVLYANGIWCVPRPQGLFLGATLEEGQTQEGNTIKTATLLNNLIELFPELADHPLEELEYYYGFRPKLDGEIPLIQRDENNPNIVWAIGQQNNGVLMAPYTAARVAQEIG